MEVHKGQKYAKLVHIYNKLFMNIQMGLNQHFSTSVAQKFLKHTVPDDLVRGTDLFSLRLSKNDNDQHNNSCPV